MALITPGLPHPPAVTTGGDYGYVKGFSTRPNAADYMPDYASAYLAEYMRGVVNGTRDPAGLDITAEGLKNIQRGERPGGVHA